jgi:hypothetical protein
MDFAEALHIVSGDSAAGTLKFALQLRRDRVLINEDPISVGPARFSGDLASWKSTREQFLAHLHSDWPDFSFDRFSDNGLLANAPRLAEPTDKVIWAGAGLPDQLSICWVTALSRLFGASDRGLHVVQFERSGPNQYVLGMGEVSPDRIVKHSPGTNPLSEAEISEYRDAWATYTSNDPSDLSRYLDTPARQPILQRAMRSLVLRYPDKKTGLSYCDELILKYAADTGPRVARVVGYTIGFYEAMDSLGDLYVFDRVRRLSQHVLRKPLLEYSGDQKQMRASEVQLTDFGRDVLFGNANAIAENGIDDRIGGVHLSGDRPSAHRDGSELVID